MLVIEGSAIAALVDALVDRYMDTWHDEAFCDANDAKIALLEMDMPESLKEAARELASDYADWIHTIPR